MLRRAASCWGYRTEDEQHTIRFEDEDGGVETVYEQALSSVFMLGPFLTRAQFSFGALNRLFPEIVRYLSEKYQISLQYIDVLTQAQYIQYHYFSRQAAFSLEPTSTSIIDGEAHALSSPELALVPRLKW